MRSRETNLLEELVKGKFGQTAGLRVDFDRSFDERSDGDTNQGSLGITDEEQVREMEVCLGDWNPGA